MSFNPNYYNIPVQLESIHFGDHVVELFVPEPGAVKSVYTQLLTVNQNLTFPYWSRIWPAAIAMVQYLEKRPSIYSGKMVVELAAGLGLPSLFTAPLAKSVTCSDFEQAAVTVMSKSVIHNKYSNVFARVLDWNSIRETIPGDLLILSDINYDTKEFPTLEKIIKGFIMNKGIVVLSTPQRLVAKQFITKLAAHIEEDWHTSIPVPGEESQLTVFKLA